MAKLEHITMAKLLEDPKSVLERVEAKRTTLTVVDGTNTIAVISPAPVRDDLEDLHRAMLAEDPDSSFYLDAMETRRNLGL